MKKEVSPRRRGDRIPTESALREFSDRLVTMQDATVDVDETASKYFIYVEMPGVTQRNVQLSVSNGQLIVTGKRASESSKSARNRTSLEQSIGFYQRVFPLPEGVTAGAVEAMYHDHVLKISFPKGQGLAQEVAPRSAAKPVSLAATVLNGLKIAAERAQAFLFKKEVPPPLLGSRSKKAAAPGRMPKAA